jgi:hypothetical protein
MHEQAQTKSGKLHMTPLYILIRIVKTATLRARKQIKILVREKGS